MFTFIVVILSIIADQLLKKKYSIKSNGWVYKWISVWHGVTEMLVIAISVTFFFFIIGSPDSNYFMNIPILVILFFILFSTRAWFEWYFEKESKRYILTLNMIAAILLIMGLAIVFI